MGELLMVHGVGCGLEFQAKSQQVQLVTCDFSVGKADCNITVTGSMML